MAKFGNVEIIKPIDGMHPVEQIVRSLEAEVESRGWAYETNGVPFSVFLVSHLHGVGLAVSGLQFSDQALAMGAETDITPPQFIDNFIEALEAGEHNDWDLYRHLYGHARVIPDNIVGVIGLVEGRAPHAVFEDGRFKFEDVPKEDYQRTRVTYNVMADGDVNILVRYQGDLDLAYIHLKEDIQKGENSVTAGSDWGITIAALLGVLLKAQDATDFMNEGIKHDGE